MAGDAAPADLAFFVIDEAAAGDPAAACMFAPGAFAGPVGLVTLRVAGAVIPRWVARGG